MHGSTWPAPDDATGWAQVVATGRLARCDPGRLVAALRALVHTADERLVNAIAWRLSEIVIRGLRAAIGTDHPNRGEDMILRAHGAIFEAILDPDSADGAELVEHYGSRTHFRGLDAVRVERRYQARHISYDADEGLLARAGAPGPLGAMTVEQLLTRVTDVRKRLALRLTMEGMQIRVGDPCVASVLGVDPKTAKKWIDEARAILRAHLRQGDHR